MNQRGHEGPMEFEWQTTGPADATSPFHQLAMKHQAEQSKMFGLKRSHSVFDSPLKPLEPAPPSQPFAFVPSSPVKRFLNQHNTSFATPRKMEVDPASSGAELSSPDNADVDDTPERRPLASMALVRTGDASVETQHEEEDENDDNDYSDVNGGDKATRKKTSIFGKHAAATATITASPGRGEIRRGKFADAITRRIRKRRRQEIGRDARLALRQSSYDSESDDPRSIHARRHQQLIKDKPVRSSSPSSSQQAQVPSSSMIPAIFAWLESHPHLPHVLSFYAQLLLNVFLIFSIIYLIYSFWATVRSDVDKHSESVAAEILVEMAACAQQFVANRCEREHRVPAMESVCDNWERCMNKDPNSVGRARVSAHTFAEIFNSFVEPISYKAMIFTLILVFGCVAISNLAFGLIRAKASPNNFIPSVPLPPPPPPQQQPFPSASANTFLSTLPPHTPHHHHRRRQLQGYYPYIPYTNHQHQHQQPTFLPDSIEGRGEKGSWTQPRLPHQSSTVVNHHHQYQETDDFL